MNNLPRHANQSSDPGEDLPDWMKTKPPPRKGMHRRTRSSMPEEFHQIMHKQEDIGGGEGINNQ